jgi:hypothetical protein
MYSTYYTFYGGAHGFIFIFIIYIFILCQILSHFKVRFYKIWMYSQLGYQKGFNLFLKDSKTQLWIFLCYMIIVVVDCCMSKYKIMSC